MATHSPGRRRLRARIRAALARPTGAALLQRDRGRPEVPRGMA